MIARPTEYRLGLCIVGTCALLGAVLFAALGPASAQEQVGTVQAVKQNAFGQISGAQRNSLGLQDKIVRNELLATDVSGLASVNFMDGSVLSLASNSNVTIDDFVFTGSETQAQMVVHISTGIFRFVTGELTKSGVQIHTPTVLIGVRGTVFQGSVSSDGTTRVEVSEGQVSVLPNGQTSPTIVGPGQAVTVHPDGTSTTDTFHTITGLDASQFAGAGPATPSSSAGYRATTYAGTTTGAAGSTTDAKGVAAAVGSRAPGGIILGAASDQTVTATNVKYDQTTNRFTADGWTYAPPVSRRELYDLFVAVSANDFIVLDITTTGENALFGVPKDSLVAKRMMMADIFLGDIAKGFHYLTPIYKMAGGYDPVEYQPVAGHRFAVMFDFQPKPFTVAGGSLGSGGRTITPLIVPVVVGNDGVRHFDFDAMSGDIQNPAIKQNVDHLLKNIDYYGKERVVKAMYAYSEVADFARILKRSGIRLDSFWSTPPPP